MNSPGKSAAGKAVFFKVYLVEKRQGVPAILRSLSVDTAGKVRSVDLISKAPPEPQQSTLRVDPQALLFALMAAGLDYKDLANHLVVCNDQSANQATISLSTPGNPWEPRGQAVVIDLWPSVLVRRRMSTPFPLQSDESAASVMISGAHLGDIIRQLTDLGITVSDSLIEKIRATPDTALLAIHGLLLHPYINTKVGREALRIIFTGTCKKYESGDYRYIIVRGLALLLRCDPPREVCNDLNKLGLFCELLRWFLWSHAFLPPKEQGDFNIQLLPEALLSAQSKQRRHSASRPTRVLQQPISPSQLAEIIQAMKQLGFEEGHILSSMLAPFPHLVPAVMRWLLCLPYILNGKGRDALRILFAGAIQRYYENAQWEAIVEALEFLLNCQLPPELKYDPYIFAWFIKLINTALFRQNFQAALFNRDRVQD